MRLETFTLIYSTRFLLQYAMSFSSCHEQKQAAFLAANSMCGVNYICCVRSPRVNYCN